MRTNIHHNTGRTYNGAQSLFITVHVMETDTDNGMDICELEFIDESRNIHGRTGTVLIFSDDDAKVIGRLCLSLYDGGKYSLV